MRFLLASTEASTAGFRDEAQLFVEGKKRSDACGDGGGRRRRVISSEDQETGVARLVMVSKYETYCARRPITGL